MWNNKFNSLGKGEGTCISTRLERLLFLLLLDPWKELGMVSLPTTPATPASTAKPQPSLWHLWAHQPPPCGLRPLQLWTSGGSAAVRTFFLEGFSKIISFFLLSQLVSRGLFCLTWLRNVLETGVIQSGFRWGFPPRQSTPSVWMPWLTTLGAPTPFPRLQTSVRRALLTKWRVQPKDEVRYRKQANRKLKGPHTRIHRGLSPYSNLLFLSVSWICKFSCNTPSINN